MTTEGVGNDKECLGSSTLCGTGDGSTGELQCCLDYRCGSGLINKDDYGTLVGYSDEACCSAPIYSYGCDDGMHACPDNYSLLDSPPTGSYTYPTQWRDTCCQPVVQTGGDAGVVGCVGYTCGPGFSKKDNDDGTLVGNTEGACCVPDPDSADTGTVEGIPNCAVIYDSTNPYGSGTCPTPQCIRSDGTTLNCCDSEPVSNGWGTNAAGHVWTDRGSCISNIYTNCNTGDFCSEDAHEGGLCYDHFNDTTIDPLSESVKFWSYWWYCAQPQTNPEHDGIDPIEAERSGKNYFLINTTERVDANINNYGGFMNIVPFDFSTPSNCDEDTMEASACTSCGQERYTMTAAANGGRPCRGSSTLCGTGDGPEGNELQCCLDYHCIDQSLSKKADGTLFGNTDEVCCEGSSYECGDDTPTCPTNYSLLDSAPTGSYTYPTQWRNHCCSQPVVQIDDVDPTGDTLCLDDPTGFIRNLMTNPSASMFRPPGWQPLDTNDLQDPCGAALSSEGWDCDFTANYMYNVWGGTSQLIKYYKEDLNMTPTEYTPWLDEWDTKLKHICPNTCNVQCDQD
jgi:hypothetical protein